MRYHHKMDWWIRIILILSVVMFIPLFFVIPPEEVWIMVITELVMGVIIIPLFFGYIEFMDDHLYIKIHFFHQRIKYDNIKSIRLCKNLFSSSAMTTERIEIKEHNKSIVRGTTYIGPEDREEVYQELLFRCRNLEQQQ